MCIVIYIFNLKKQKNKKAKKKKTAKGKKQIKESKKEKRLSVENLTAYSDMVYEFVLCTFNLLIEW